MNALKAKITLLVLGAIVAMSIIGIAGAQSVAMLLAPADQTTFMFRYAGHPESRVVGTEIGTPSSVVDLVILGYALLIVAGSSVVGLVVANMVVRPLAILEDAVNSVDPEGFIPRIDEKGLGEDLEAAKLINRLSARLRKAMDSRMRLVAAAGHDLRTPMTRMRLRLEFMEDNEDKPLWERDIEEMTHIAESAIRLVREETGAMEAEVIELDMLVRDLCSELAELGHQVAVLSLDRATVKGGYHSIKRAISNLVLNAATHGNAAEVTLFTDDKEAVILICDDGPGIPDDLIDQAFEPFFRVTPGREKTANGAGLGLAIVKEIVTRHGGKVTLSNIPGRGLSQVVELPLA